MKVILIPGATPLKDWRAIYRGAVPALDPGAHSAIKESAAAVERILARGEAVYGVNTGFGKLASVRIENDEGRLFLLEQHARFRARGRDE